MSPFSPALRGRRARRGVGAVELAIAAPILLGFILGLVDLGRYVLNLHRISAAAAAVADLGSQADFFTAETDPAKVASGRELGVLALAGTETARPLALLDEGVLIVSSVANQGGVTTVLWQQKWGTGMTSQVSASSLKGVTLRSGEAAVYAEVGYHFEPYLLSGRLLGLDKSGIVRTVAVRRPRQAGAVVKQP